MGMVLVGGMAQRTRNGRRLTVAMMTREEEQLETCGVRGQLRGEADGGGPRPRGNWAWVWWGGESVMGTVPVPREL
jgi:hypothetical protein